MPLPTAEQIISHLSLQPHPEGGFFTETFRDSPILPTYSSEPLSTPPHDQAPLSLHNRAASTQIYYLLPHPHFSSLHRIDAVEGWHYYMGTVPLEIVELDFSNDEEASSATPLKVTRLGTDILAGERPQYVVRKGKWFGARLPKEQAKEGDWVLVGCSVAPGFVFEGGGFEMGKNEVLSEESGHWCRGREGDGGVGSEVVMDVQKVIEEMCRE